MKSYRAFLIPCLLLIATGTYGGENKLPSKKTFELSGQVFVVTKGRENIKLALVDITAIPDNKMTQYIKFRHIEGLHQQEMLLPELEAAKQEVHDAQVAKEQADKKTDDARQAKNRNKKIEDIHRTVQEHSDAILLGFAASDTLEKKEQKLRGVKFKFRYYDSADFYFEKLPDAIVMTKTDADGKFSLSLPSGKYVVAAKTSRKVFDDSETYFWLVTIDTASNNHSIMLSNDNLLETGCKECVSLGSATSLPQ